MTVADGLARIDHKVDLVLINATGPYVKTVTTNVRLIDLSSQRVIRSVFKLAGYIKEHSPDYIVANLPHVNIASFLAKTISRSKSKLILTEHNTLSQSIANAQTLRGKHLDKLMRLVYPKSDRVVAVSNGVAQDLATTIQFPRRDIQVIYNPVVTPTLLANADSLLCHPWFQPSCPPTILGVGRLTYAKNFQVLLKAFAKIRKELFVRLVILGDGPERANLIQLADNLGVKDDLFMPGFVENPYKYMRNATVFALSSRWEGLPTVLIEALACGTPVISTDCPHGPREILEEGRWGTLVPVNDCNALANALKKSLVNPPPTIPRDSWLKFTSEYAISGYVELLENIAH